MMLSVSLPTGAARPVLEPLDLDRDVVVTIENVPAILGNVCVAESEVSAVTEGCILWDPVTRFTLRAGRTLWLFTDSGVSTVAGVIATEIP